MSARPGRAAGDRDRFWLAIAIIVLWLSSGAGLLIGAVEIYQRSLKLWWPA